MIAVCSVRFSSRLDQVKLAIISLSVDDVLFHQLADHWHSLQEILPQTECLSERIVIKQFSTYDA